MSKILPVRAAAARCCWTRRYIILNTGQSGDYLSSRGFNSTERKNAMSNGVVRFLGWRGALIHGDAMVIDRWKWLTKRLRVAKSGESLLDVGCGTGAFTIGFAKKGYTSTGLSWDERNQKVAEERAKLASVEKFASRLAMQGN